MTIKLKLNINNYHEIEYRLIVILSYMNIVLLHDDETEWGVSNPMIQPMSMNITMTLT